MLTDCPECKKQVSDRAAACPHCGHPLAPLPVESAPAPEKARAAPVFLILAFAAVLVGLSVPRLLIFMPIFAAIGFSIVSIARSEKGAVFASLPLLGGIGLWALSAITSG